MPVARDPAQRCLHYRRFRTGITSMSMFTADDMVALTQQMHYAVGLDASVLVNPVVRHAFIAANSLVLKMLIILKKRVVTEDELMFLHECAQRFGAPLRVLVESIENPAKRPKINIPKVHAMTHMR